MNTETDKTVMKYRVFTARNPKTGGSLLRPIVVNRSTLNTRQIVAYAKTAGYVRGQTKDLEGLLGGFIQAMQDRALAGYSINVNNWFIVSGQLKGSVGEDRLLSAANSYHVTLTATKELKASIDNFSWQRVDEGVVIKVESLASPGGVKDQIIKSKTITASGKNLSYHEDWGDSVSVSWREGDETRSAAIVPIEQSETYLRFDWIAELADVPVETDLTFVFRLHAEKDGSEQVSTRTVQLVSAS